MPNYAAAISKLVKDLPNNPELQRQIGVDTSSGPFRSALVAIASVLGKRVNSDIFDQLIRKLTTLTLRLSVLEDYELLLMAGEFKNKLAEYFSLDLFEGNPSLLKLLSEDADEKTFSAYRTMVRDSAHESIKQQFSMLYDEFTRRKQEITDFRTLMEGFGDLE